MKAFVVQRLMASKIADAYGFARLSTPGLEAIAWRRHALSIVRHSGRRTGILVILRRTRRHICGLVSYRYEMDLQLGRVLRVRHLVAIDMLDANPILSALLEQLTGIARRLRCKVIHIVLPDAEREQESLYGALLQLRPGLAIQRRFGVDWDVELI